MVFMVIGLGALQDIPEDELKKIALIYEFRSQAGPRGINGMPMFTSCRFIHLDDLPMLDKAIVAELDRRKAIGDMFEGAPDAPPA